MYGQIEGIDICDIALPFSWPLYPLLPVVRRRPPETIGLLYDAKNHCKIGGYQFTVFLCNIEDVGCHSKYSNPQLLFDTCPQEKYDSYEAIKAAGWEPG